MAGDRPVPFRTTTVRYLACAGSRTGDYTHNPRQAIDTLPALDEHELEQLAWRARQTDLIRERTRAGERRRQPYTKRLDQARAQARLTGVRVDNELRLARLAIDAGRRPTQIERRLELVEQRVFPQRFTA